jgi:hypothetical protein
MKEKPVKSNIREKIFFVISAFLAGFALTYKQTEAIPFWAYGKVTLDFIKARLYTLMGDYQFDMIAASILAGCAIYLVREKFGRNLKGYVLPFILGFIVILGRSALATGSLDGCFGAFPLLIRSALAGIGYGIIFRNVFALFEALLDKFAASSTDPGNLRKVYDRICFRNVFILLMVLWLPVMVINFPGNYNSDFIGQMMQTTGEMPWSTHHPIVLTAFIGIFFGAIHTVTGSYDAALFLWILMQSAALAASLSLTVSFLKKKGAGALPLITVIGIYVLSPIYSNIASTAIKDVPFAAACIWYCVLVTELYEDTKGFLGDKKKIAMICLAAFFICMCRNNGVIIVFVNGVVMCVYGMKDKAIKTGLIKKFLVFLIIPICLHTALSSGIAAATDAESDGLKEMLSIPIQQTARYITKYESEMTDEETESIDALFGDHMKMIEGYDPFISDPVKRFYDTDASKTVVTSYFKTWFRQFFKHPGVYFESFFMSTFGWFDPEADTAVRYEEDLYYVSKNGIVTGADEALVVIYRYLNSISLLGFLQSPGLWTWIMLILIRRKKGSLHLYPMQIISLLVCMAGPCFMKHARYAFPIMFTIPFMMGYDGISDRSVKK